MDLKYLSYLFILLWVISCKGNKPEEQETGKEQEIKKEFIQQKPGIIHEGIKCKKDTGISYALYLPQNYSEDKEFPIILFFDAHARASLPLEKYKELADKYEFILAASEQSQNSQEWSYSAGLGHTLIKELTKYYAVDKNQLITSGFSGGARVASGLAISRYDIRGVIACAAGFPGNAKAANTRINFLGIVGNQDFNYLELKNVDKQLENALINHYLIEFDGGHDWPEAKIFEEAMLFHYFENRRTKSLSEKDSIVLKEFINKQLDKIKTYKDSKNFYKMGLAYNKLLTFTKPFTDLAEFDAILKDIADDENVNEAFKENEALLESEIKLREEYTGYLGMQQIAWWKNEIRKLKAKASKSTQQGLVYIRLMKYLSMSSNMKASYALSQNNLEYAAYFLDIYKLVDPDNKDVYFLTAIYLAKSNDRDNTLLYLKRAIELGFDDMTRIKTEAAFQQYLSDVDFQTLLK